MPSPDVHPLGKIRRLTAVCDDCGWRAVWGKDRIARARASGLRNPEEIGSSITCECCTTRGQGGRNISVYTDAIKDRPAAPADKRILSEITSALVTCGHCGHRVFLDRERLWSLASEVKTVHDLWRKAFCQPCREAGSTKPEITLEVVPPLIDRGPLPRTEPQPMWSTATVFGEDRTDPFPTLPRRARFHAA